MRSLICALVLSLSLAAAGQSLDEARSAYQRGDYRSARGALTVHAEAGNVEAQYLLGRMYANGEGVLQDFVPAHKWLNLAASQGSGEARALRDDISSRMTAAQLAEAQQQARAWQPRPLPAGQLAAGAAPPPPPAARDTAPPAAGNVTRAAPSSQRELVRDTQTMLAELGYDPGPADGLMGGRTRSAIRAYQLHSGVAVTGEPSAALHAALASDLGYADRRTPGPAGGGAGAAAGGSGASAPAPAAREPVYVTESRSRGAPPAQGGTRLPEAEPVARLREIIDAGEARGGADPRFVDSLRDLVAQHDWPWRRVLVEETFSDGDYTRSPRWEVLGGQFWVSRNEGLRTQVAVSAPSAPGAATPPASEERPSGKDLGLALLGAILAQGQPQGSAGAADSGEAEIRLPLSLPAAFAIQAQLVSGEPGGRLELGVYQGSRADTGYRLAYLGGGTRALQLLRYGGAQQSVIELYDPALSLEDGRAHDLLWSRDDDGRMRVVLDGRMLFSVTDRAVAGGFNGVTLANRGGNYALRSLRVLTE